MTLDTRNQRALIVLGIAAALLVARLATLGSPGGAAAPAATALDTIAAKERRLDRARNLSALVPGHRQTLEKVRAELDGREKGLIQADTAAQAQAQLITIVRRVAREQDIDIRGSELGQVRPLGQDYGEALVAVTFDCQIEQFVNFLAALTTQPELVASSEMRVSQAGGKDKRMNVRLQVSGVVPRRLVPERRGGTL